MKYTTLIFLFVLFTPYLHTQCKVIIWDISPSHGSLVKKSFDDEYGNPNNSCLFLDLDINQLKDSINKYNTKSIIRSVAGADPFDNFAADLWYNNISFFMPLGSNSHVKIDNTPADIIEALIRTGAGVDDNETAYGNSLEFFDTDPTSEQGSQKSSYSNAIIAAKLLKIKEARKMTWWDARHAARQTASEGGTHSLNNGFGKINVQAAINYNGNVPSSPFPHDIELVTIDRDSIPSGAGIKNHNRNPTQLDAPSRADYGLTWYNVDTGQFFVYVFGTTNGWIEITNDTGGGTNGLENLLVRNIDTGNSYLVSSGQNVIDFSGDGITVDPIDRAVKIPSDGMFAENNSKQWLTYNFETNTTNPTTQTLGNDLSILNPNGYSYSRVSNITTTLGLELDLSYKILKGPGSQIFEIHTNSIGHDVYSRIINSWGTTSLEHEEPGIFNNVGVTQSGSYLSGSEAQGSTYNRIEVNKSSILFRSPNVNANTASIGNQLQITGFNTGGSAIVDFVDGAQTQIHTLNTDLMMLEDHSHDLVANTLRYEWDGIWSNTKNYLDIGSNSGGFPTKNLEIFLNNINGDEGRFEADVLASGINFGMKVISSAGESARIDVNKNAGGESAALSWHNNDINPTISHRLGVDEFGVFLVHPGTATNGRTVEIGDVVTVSGFSPSGHAIIKAMPKIVHTLDEFFTGEYIETSTGVLKKIYGRVFRFSGAIIAGTVIGNIPDFEQLISIDGSFNDGVDRNRPLNSPGIRNNDNHIIIQVVTSASQNNVEVLTGSGSNDWSGSHIVELKYTKTTN